MKPEDHAWRSLQQHASAQLNSRFADRVLRAANGPCDETWQSLRSHGAAQLRPGFAARVLRAARKLPGVPSLLDQLVFSAGTAIVCIVGTLYFHSRSLELENERNLASWHQIAMFVQDADTGL
jgi:hypothetical protein